MKNNRIPVIDNEFLAALEITSVLADLEMVNWPISSETFHQTICGLESFGIR